MPQSDSRSVLDTPMGHNDANGDTIRHYLVALLTAVWDEGEGFTGKRPFGNSMWQWELYTALAKAGHVHGTLGEHGYINNVDTRAGNALISNAIRALAGPVTDTTAS